MENRKVVRKRPILFWPELLRGTLIRRYQRFKADVRLGNGRLITALCPNTGSMLECSEPGRFVYLSRQNRPERKLKYTWELIDMQTSLVGVNTGVPNRLVRETVLAGGVPELAGFQNVRSEVNYGNHSRIDLLLTNGHGKCYVEVKNCTLVEAHRAYFPDAVTARGLKHLKDLQEEVRSGNRAVMFFLIQRMDAEVFSPADHIDPEYGREFRKALDGGVEMLAYDVKVDLAGIRLNQRIPIHL